MYNLEARLLSLSHNDRSYDRKKPPFLFLNERRLQRMNIHYAFSIRSDGGDDDSDDDDEDVDKGGDNADDDGEDENLLFVFQGSQRGRGQ